jgi:hypothetical protein
MTRTFYKTTLTLTIYSDTPLDDDDLGTIMSRDYHYGTSPAAPVVVSPSPESYGGRTTETLTGEELAIVLADLAGSSDPSDIETLDAFKIDADGNDL